MTLQELAAETNLTKKTLRKYIHEGQLKATFVWRGRIHKTFTVTRDQADTWLAWRAHRKITRTLPSTLQKGARPQKELSIDGGDSDMLVLSRDFGAEREALKRSAIDGDVDARLRIKLPWEQGGMQVVSWWSREAGTIV